MGKGHRRYRDHRLRAEFYNIQRELAQIIMKEVVGKTGMFHEEGEMSREDIRTQVAAQGTISLTWMDGTTCWSD